MNVLDAVDAASLRKDVVNFRPGDEIKIHVRVIEGNKSRIQLFRESLSAVRVLASARPSPSASLPTVSV